MSELSHKPELEVLQYGTNWYCIIDKSDKVPLFSTIGKCVNNKGVR